MKKIFFTLAGVLLSGFLLGQAVTVVFHENFEPPSGSDSVTHYSSSSTNTWGLSTSLSFGGTQSDSAVASPYDTLTITTDPFSTTGRPYTILEFDHICKIEAFDKGVVEVSVDGGITWIPLDTNHYRGSSTEFGPGGNYFNVTSYDQDWLNGQAIRPDNTWWKPELFDISVIAGDEPDVRIRFSLIDLNGMTLFENEGWFIDNIKVTASISELEPPVITMLSPIPRDTILNDHSQEVRAEITDNTAVDSGYVVYYVNGVLEDTIGMDNVTGDIYSVHIPFEGYGHVIDYFVGAVDAVASANTSTGSTYTYVQLEDHSLTFTNAGATGAYGPSQAQLDVEYSATDLAGQVISENGIQRWEVPYTAEYRITAIGARGGYQSGNNDSAGLGAYMEGIFHLTGGESLKILVGQEGMGITIAGGTGGGGSFVTLSNDTPLIVAAGGSGAPNSTNYGGLNGKVTNRGPYGGTGNMSTNMGGGGGGGLLTDGTSANPANGGKAFVNGGYGGIGAGGNGGFGGGGGKGGYYNDGAGGGGYSGGDHSYSATTYGGGGSFNAGTSQNNKEGAGYGHGIVIIEPLTIPSEAYNDAGVASIDEPAVFCPGANDVVVTIMNYGKNPIDSVEVHWEVNGVPQPPATYVGSLDTIGGTNPPSAQVNLGSYTFTNATYHIKAWTANPNGIPDLSNDNDTVFSVVQSSLPPPTGLTVIDSSATTVTFSWTGGSSAHTWIYVVVPRWDSPGTGTPVEVTTNSTTATNLSPLTLYDIYVAELCPGGTDTSTWAGPVTFETLFGCPVNAFCFTNAGATGSTGPTQSQLNAEYMGSLQVQSVNGYQRWLVPQTGSYKISAFGAEGGGANTSHRGQGGLAQGEVTLTSGNILYVAVGQAGQYGHNASSPAPGGFNGGGAGGMSAGTCPSGFGSSGGGASDVRIGDTTLASRMIVAAGGGGGTGDGNETWRCGGGGGGGGGYYGGGGGMGGDMIPQTQGMGGTQSGGGLGGGTTTGNTNGGPGYGGHGGHSNYMISYSSNANQYGGDGGGFSGQDGNDETFNRAKGGGGGASYIGGTPGYALTNTSTQTGSHEGHGMVIIKPLFQVQLPEYDAGIVSIDEPGVYCPGANDVVVTIANMGSMPIDSVGIEWTVNGVAQPSYSYVGTLDTAGGSGSSTAQLTIGSYTFTNAPYHIVAWSSSPNGQPDTINSNDTAYATVQANLPAPTGLTVTDSSGTTATFTWSGGSPTHTWIYVVVPQGASPGSGTPVEVTTNSATATNLSPLSFYDVYVAELCPGGTDTSAWEGPAAFETLFACPANAFCFTNAGATGSTGPTQAQMDAEYTGTMQAQSVNGYQRWVVPQSGDYKIMAFGAEGGGVNTSHRGQGGRTEGVTTLNSGNILYVGVGQAGQYGHGAASVPPGGFNGGGAGGSSQVNNYHGSSGGGASDVRIGDTTLSSRLIIAAGGGGGTGDGNQAWSNGGGGGGGGGYYGGGGGHGGNESPYNPGTGGTQTGGGTGGGTTSGNTNGGLGYGGHGGHSMNTSTFSSNTNQYGGDGGGLTGQNGNNGGAGSRADGGGGGSSYIGGIPGYTLSNTSTQTGFHEGHGLVIIQPQFQFQFSENDAGVLSIDEPDVYCPGANDVVVTIANMGSIRIDSVDIEWTVNGVPQPPYSYVGILDTAGGSGSAAAQVTIGSYNFTSAPYHIVAWTSNPNGLPDTINSNDTAYATVQSNLPAPTGLTIIDSSGTTGTFTWTTSSPAHTWLYVVVPQGASPATGIPVEVTTDSATATNLSPLSFYDVYVAELCPGGTDTSAWAGPATFKTLFACLSHAFCFTNAGAAGSTGPTQAQLDTEYMGTMQVQSVNGYQRWIVPESGDYNIIAYGASGGGANASHRGQGGQTEGEVTFTKGDILYVVVGQAGQYGHDTPLPPPGGFNGGGSGGVAGSGCATYHGSSGGGASDIRIGDTTLANRVIVAAGGGGGSGDSYYTHSCAGGGAGGGGYYGGGGGHAGYISTYPRIPGGGGTQTHGGAGGGTEFGTTDGTLGRGGDGGNSTATSSFSNSNNVYGGDGGGLTGQTGGASTYNTQSDGGGGGSSYIGGIPGYPVNNGSTQPGLHEGHGAVVIEPLFFIQKPPNDAGVAFINEPHIFCPGANDVVVTIANMGSNQMDSVDIDWTVNGVAQPTYSYTGLLDTAGGSNPATAQVTIGTYTFTSAPYDLVVWSTNPNGQQDTMNANDTAYATVQASLLTPSGITVTDSSATTGTFTWTGGSPHNTWIYVVVHSGNAPESGTPTEVTLEHATATGLSPVTLYDVYVAELCPGGTDTSSWAGPATFQTTFLCPLHAYCFTNAGANGATGPTQAELNQAYNGTNLDGQVVSENGIQQWKVPYKAYYRITAYGAEGGFDPGNYAPAGLGAQMEGKFVLNGGDSLKVLVGQKGTGVSGGGGTGGGGSFVAFSDDTPLIIAGGGSGAPGDNNYGQLNGKTTNQGPNGGSGHPGLSSGGGGGGGYLSGGVSLHPNLSGKAFVNGGEGGTGNGGFGGGGGKGGSADDGAGGGGYSGGDHTHSATTYGGGGSYNSGTNQNNQEGSREGHGIVIIKPLKRPNDAGVIALTEPHIFCPGPNNVMVQIQNFGTNVINNVEVNWSINGTTQTPVMYTGTLDTSGGTGSKTDEVNLGSYTFTNAPYDIIAWTSNPNNEADTININDTTYATVQSKPIPTTFPALPDVCADAPPVTLSATPTGGVFSGPGVYGNAFNPGTTGPGTYTLHYTYTDTMGCMGEDSSQITVIPLPDVTATASPNPVDYGDATTLDASVSGASTYSYSWAPADSLDNPANATLQNPTTKPLTTPNTFTVTVTDNAAGCINTDNVFVSIIGGTLSTQPIADHDMVCSGDSTKLYAQASGGSGIYTYNWNSIPAGFTSTQANPVAVVNEPTTFIVTVDDGTDTTFGTVTVNSSKPHIDLGPDTTIHADESLILSVDAGYADYIWSTGDTTHTITVDGLTAGPGTHNIWVTVTDSLGCTASDSITVTITTGIHKIAYKGNIHIFPNPSKGIFNVKAWGIPDKELDICVYNLKGQKIICDKTVRIPESGYSKTFDLSAQPKGVYLIRISGNTTLITKHIIIQ